MSDSLRFSLQGVPTWFSPKHAAEKFSEIASTIAAMASDAERAKRRTLAEQLREVRREAAKYARHYGEVCPIQSVRIMKPSGAIFVVLANGTEVLVPQSPMPLEDSAD